MSKDEEYLRDFAAMFAMCGMLMRGEQGVDIVDKAYEYADAFMHSRTPQEDTTGIAAIKPKKKYERKS